MKCPMCGSTEKIKCYICGLDEKVTLHHMRDIHSKKNKRKVNGLIPLCRNCHNVVEDIVNKHKSKNEWYERGFRDAQKIKREWG